MKYEINVPENLNEVTLGQYQEFIKLDIDNENLLGQKMVEIFCNVNELIVRNMKASDIIDICNLLNEMFATKHQLINKFNMNGVAYGFVPDLNDMTFGEYVDIDMYIGDIQNMHLAMNVLFRPIELKRKDKYKIAEYNPQDAEKMKDMPLDVCLGAMVFFWNLGMELSQVMMDYSIKNNEENLMRYLNSAQNGDGTPVSMDSLKAILQDLKISLN